MINYDPKKIKKQIQAEQEMHSKFGPGKIWSFILSEIFNNDVDLAKEFMLSNDGGYEPEELNRVIREKHTHKNKYNEKLQSGLRAF